MENNISCDNDKTIVKQHCKNPSIQTIDNFLDEDTCTHFINIAKDKLQQALVSTNKEGIVSKGRSGKNCWISHDYDELTLMVANKIANFIGLPLRNAEKYQIIYYDTNQEYRNHMDSWEHDDSDKSKRCMKFGGQRMFTALCYLNNVLEGGETKFTKKNISVIPKLGKLLIFQNVFPGTNKRDPMSEHAGCPVITGEKWGFNLWFREDDFSKIVPYSLKKLNHTINGLQIIKEELETEIETETKEAEAETETETETETKAETETETKAETETETKAETETETLNETETETETKTKTTDLVKVYNNVISEEDISSFEIELGKNYFETNTSKKEVMWVKNDKFPKFIEKIEKLTNESSEFFENICFVKYPSEFVHGYHFDAFCTKLQSSKAFTEARGQRLSTITGFISEGISYTFKSSSHINFDKSSLLFYNNVNNNTIDRIQELSKTIKNNLNKSVILFNIYVRQFSKSKKLNPSCKLIDNIKNTQTRNIQNTENIDYCEVLDDIYEKFENKTISMKGFKTIDFGAIKSNNWKNICSSVLQLKSIRTATGILNEKYLTETYIFDEYNPIIINNVFTTKAIDLISKFYTDGIVNNQFTLGDRQSKRFKTRNDPYSRIIQYELLPLVEKFTNKKLRPTYTYLSCYIKGSDLPAHGDNPNCEFTVSYLLDKPENSSWNIYFHKKRQEKHCGGRSSFTPNIDECIACDCDKGGLMSFKGQDHLHFRDKLEHDYYNLLLLHYVTIDNTEADKQILI